MEEESALDDASEDALWQWLTSSEFLKGYAAGDAIYDSEPSSEAREASHDPAP